MSVDKEIHAALVRVLHMAEAALSDTGDNPDANECRKVSQYIEHGVIPDGEKTQVFNVANLKEQMQDNVLAVLDGLLDHIGPAVKNAVEGQVCQVILDTIDPPQNRSHTGPDGIEFYVQRTDLHEWSVFQKYTDIHGSTWETSPCDIVDDCDTEAEAVQSYKEMIQGRIDAES